MVTFGLAVKQEEMQEESDFHKAQMFFSSKLKSQIARKCSGGFFFPQGKLLPDEFHVSETKAKVTSAGFLKTEGSGLSPVPSVGRAAAESRCLAQLLRDQSWENLKLEPSRDQSLPLNTSKIQ